MQAVFLDRDGVLNRAPVQDGRPGSPRSLEELEILADAPEALRGLKAAGFRLVVVTNQPNVARGEQTRESIEAIDDALRTALPLDDFFTCYHDDADRCACRKPRPGLLLQAAEQHGIDLRRSYMVGDRWRDIDAGAAAGCKTVLIDYHYREPQPRHPPDARVASLSAAARWILGDAGFPVR